MAYTGTTMRRIHSSAWGHAALAVSLLCAASSALAQALVVFPVNIQMQPGQRATALTVTNRGTDATSIQLRAYSWNQTSGEDELLPSNEILVSPPLATIPGGATQIIRVVLRHADEGKETTFRLIIDHIPPPATPGQVAVVLRLSLPIFVQATAQAHPRVEFHICHRADKTFLVARNLGGMHEVFRNVILTTKDGVKLNAETNGSPYVLAGATRQWQIVANTVLTDGDTIELNADVGAAKTKLQVPVSDEPHP